jgi:dihydroneopterin aldolase / 2-amino-4-hydroxy-6-hydroxymethyldihydropteridine diphosphokinase
LHADRIEVRGLRALGVIGVLPHEQAVAQPFEVDLTIFLDARDAGRTDDLTKTIDYGQAIAVAEKVITSESYLLLERVASRIAEELLSLAGVHEVEVEVRKLRPPVPQDVATTAVHIVRQRADLIARPRRTHTAYVALGSNMGDRRSHLRDAVRQLHRVTAVSHLYETDPVGGPEQGPYLNMVVELETALDPFQLLDRCLAIEAAAGRERKVRWGPRTLDLDVLLFDDVELRSGDLSIPHPRMFERRFVLEPLSDIAPHRVPKDWEQRLAPTGIRRVGDLELGWSDDENE